MKFPKVSEEVYGVPECPLVRFTFNGEQILDNTPIEVPLGWNAPETMEMMIARMVRNEVSQAAVAAGRESLDEAYDFDIPDGDAYEESLTAAELHAMVHAPEMKPEYLDRSRFKEKDDVRKRTGSGEESSQDAGKGASSSDKGVSNGGGKKYARNVKGDGGKDEAVRVRVRSDAGSGEGAGTDD